MRKQGARYRRNTVTVNPLFALNTASRNRLASTERVAMDALLEHRATADNVGEIETLVEASIRALRIAQREGFTHLDAEGIEQALMVFYRAAHAIKAARERHAKVGVYGLSFAGRAALIEADQLVAELRRPGVLLRKTWLMAFREAYSGRGVEIPPMDEVAA